MIRSGGTPRLMLLALSLLLALGACTCRASSDERAPAAASTETVCDTMRVPSDLHIVLGQTGGLAGRMRGYSLRADGTVQRWEGKYVEEHVQARRTVSPERIAAIWRRVQAVDYFEHAQQAMSHQTAFLRVTAEGRSHRVSWPIAPGQPPPETPLYELYAYVREVARTSE